MGPRVRGSRANQTIWSRGGRRRRGGGDGGGGGGGRSRNSTARIRFERVIHG